DRARWRVDFGHAGPSLFEAGTPLPGDETAGAGECLVSARMAEEPVAEGPRELAEGVEIRDAREEELDELLPLMRAYCDFYESTPTDEGISNMARTLINEPSQGAVFIARQD